MKWISVKNRMPIEKRAVLAYLKYRGIFIATMRMHDITNEYEWHIEGEIKQLHDVTHWHALPDGPSICIICFNDINKKIDKVNYCNACYQSHERFSEYFGSRINIIQRDKNELD